MKSPRFDWEEYSGILKLTGGTLPESVGKRSSIGDLFSAATAALFFHILLAIAISLAVITVPRPNPPQLVVMLPDENKGQDLVVHRLTKPTDKTPSMASTQRVNVETSIAVSDFSLPEVEDTTALDVTAMVDGMAKVGSGMSLSVDTHQQSDVNFFGISSGGKRIVFIIDAQKKMLVDEKGGMFAYDKVKNEIGAMLSSLNRRDPLQHHGLRGKKRGLPSAMNSSRPSSQTNARPRNGWIP